MDVIETYNLTKKFRNKIIIDNLNFKVEKGDFFGLIGHNGAGKSTLINTLLGLYQVSSGTFKILNCDYKYLDSVKNKIGIMPDVSNLYDDMNSLDFIKYMGGLKGVKINKNEIIQLLERVGLEYTPMKMKNYSFGMKKKVCIAQAILGNPELILLDEPTSGVDPESILKLQRLFKELNEKKNVTIFITSHNLQEIEKLCNKVAILKDGKFIVNGELDEIINAFKYNKVKINYYINEKNEDKVNVLLQEFDVKLLKNNMIEANYQEQSDIAEMVNILVKNGVGIYSVIPERTTLEKIFVN